MLVAWRRRKGADVVCVDLRVDRWAYCPVIKIARLGEQSGADVKLRWNDAPSRAIRFRLGKSANG